jgi:hypothetical protein
MHANASWSSNKFSIYNSAWPHAAYAALQLVRAVIGCSGSSTAAPAKEFRGSYTPDCVAKLFFGVGANFSRGADALARKLCRGSHEQSDFQPTAFVSSLQGIVSPKIHFEGQIAKFSRPLIF